MTKNRSRSQKRVDFINLLYWAELMNDHALEKRAFEGGLFSDEELKIVKALDQNYARLKAIVTKNLASTWTFDRLDPLERAILVWGAFELTINEPALVIYELISYTKAFIPGDAYKFINSVLDHVGKSYAEIKTHKSAA